LDVRSTQSLSRTLPLTIPIQDNALLPKFCLEFVHPFDVRTVKSLRPM